MYSLDLTAGLHRPNNDDMQHYHEMVDSKGNLFKGYHAIEDNLDCKDGKYAQHCANGNTGVIGIAVCGMSGFDTHRRLSSSNLTMVQMEKLYERCAELVIKYSIPIKPETIYTHMEYDSSDKGAHHGKIDIVYIPFLNLYGMKECGDHIRNKIQVYYDRSKKEKK